MCNRCARSKGWLTLKISSTKRMSWIEQLSLDFRDRLLSLEDMTMNKFLNSSNLSFYIYEVRGMGDTFLMRIKCRKISQYMSNIQYRR
jgi:hypothetical protein